MDFSIFTDVGLQICLQYPEAVSFCRSWPILFLNVVYAVQSMASFSISDFDNKVSAKIFSPFFVRRELTSITWSFPLFRTCESRISFGLFSSSLSSCTSIVSILIKILSCRMLRPDQCGQLTIPSRTIQAIRWPMVPAAAALTLVVTHLIQLDTIQAIPWRMVPAAVTMALTGTVRPRLDMVRFIASDISWSAHSQSRSQSNCCLGTPLNDACCRINQIN